MEAPGEGPCSESQVIPVLEEDPVDYGCEMQLLQDGAQLQLQLQPEEFVAIADYTATDETQLSFLRGEKILILRQTTADWWWGERAGCCGYIPANHLGKQLEEYDPEDTWQDEEYFDSYGTLKLHLEMLADQPRTTKYHSVILQNKESLKDKVILDVGCGTASSASSAHTMPGPRRSTQWRPVTWPSTPASWSCRMALLTQSLCSSRRWRTWCCPRRWTCWCLSGWGPVCCV
uniref:SH3 domain-containing protein n=1 Tax=Mus musculus TaxID=10090 RepID=Q3USQ4_MOUSE|nr:unnamed protein product [Mus musculus]